MKDKYEVVIVGAGPAGLQAAKTLREAGKSVVVFEKNKVAGNKVCAGGVTRKVKNYFDIPRSIVRERFKKAYIVTQRQKVEIGLENEDLIVTLERQDLGEYQVDLLKKVGGEIYFEEPVKSIEDKHVLLEEGKKIEFDYLIGADGATSIVRKHLGIITDELLSAFHYIVPHKYEQIQFFFDPTRFGMTYLWIFPLGNYASIGSAVDVGHKFRMKDLKSAFKNWVNNDLGLSIEGCEFEAAPINYDYEGFEFGNKFLIGDAGGFTSGITGEGIYSAIMSGDEIARKIIKPKYHMKRMKSWLRKKTFHEMLLRGLQVSELTAELIVELGIFLVRDNFFEDKMIKAIDG